MIIKLANGVSIDLDNDRHAIRIIVADEFSNAAYDMSVTELREMAFGGQVVTSHRIDDMNEVLTEHDLRTGSNARAWLLPR